MERLGDFSLGSSRIGVGSIITSGSGATEGMLSGVIESCITSSVPVGLSSLVGDEVDVVSDGAW